MSMGCGNTNISLNSVPTQTIAELDASKAQKEIQAARALTCKSYFERDSTPRNHFYNIYIINMRQKERNSLYTINNPLALHSDVLCALPLEKSGSLYLPGLNGNHDINYPKEAWEIETVIARIRLGFAAGYSLVGIMLSTSMHSIMAAFKNTGEFVIVDSMSGEKIELNSFTRALNQANILDNNAKTIKFHGRNINTRLQKSGNDCIRLAALYLHQILKDNDLEAYQKVNGAFLDGTLRKFEDIQKIDNARKVETVTPVIDRDQFMYSWDHRNQGFLHDLGWRGIKVGDLRSLEHGGKEHHYSTTILLSGEEIKNQYEATMWEPQGERFGYSEISQEDCLNGQYFCRSGSKKARSKQLFATNFKDLSQFRQASTAYKITDMNLTMGQLFGNNETAKMLVYLVQHNEFYLLDKNK